MRNIILVTLDSIRADHCSFLGYERQTTPTIGEFAREGVFYENAIAAGVPSLPSLFSFYTGEFYSGDPSEAFSDRDRVQSQLATESTIARRLSERGYNTVGISTNGYMSDYFGFSEGFDTFREFQHENPDKDRDLSSFQKLFGRKVAQGMSGLISNYASVLSGENIFPSWGDIYEDITKELGEVMNEDEPFFAHLFMLDPHTPYEPATINWGPRYLNKQFRYFYHINYLQYKKAQRLRGSDATLPSFIRDRIVGCYDDSIRSADQFIHQLWETVKESDPVLIIHADHGEAFGEHGYVEHPPMLHQELTRVPLVIYNGEESGKHTSPVSLRDLPDTILDIAKGIPSSNSLLGSKEWVISQVQENGETRISVRLEDWKYIQNSQSNDELYNIGEDPQEQTNVIGENSQLAGLLDSLINRHKRTERLKESVSAAAQEVNL